MKRAILNRLRSRVADHGRRNRIAWSTSRLRDCSFEFRGDNNLVDIRASFLRGAKFVLHGNGNRIVIREGCSFNGGDGGSEFYCLGDNGTIDVGERTMSQGSNFQSHDGASVTIGSDCLLAWQSGFLTGDFHGIYSAETGERLNHAKPIVVGARVWVGSKTHILKGATIPDGCIVGICSVVTQREFEPQSVIAGNPAVTVKRDVVWNQSLLVVSLK